MAPLPLHTDEHAAAAGRFGGLIANGFHTMTVLQFRTNCGR
ncbi:MaoC/PaaZ C-terminal domain-containing protein [Streptomyces sp. NBC_00582]|nr:MaoC/PaaZ C-terminal domain-containing protein [Streptomyces sp. NBC_00582]